MLFSYLRYFKYDIVRNYSKEVDIEDFMYVNICKWFNFIVLLVFYDYKLEYFNVFGKKFY